MRVIDHPFVILNGFSKCIDSALMGRSTSTTTFHEKLFNTLPSQCRHIEYMHIVVWLKCIIDKMKATRIFRLVFKLGRSTLILVFD